MFLPIQSFIICGKIKGNLAYKINVILRSLDDFTLVY